VEQRGLCSGCRCKDSGNLDCERKREERRIPSFGEGVGRSLLPLWRLRADLNRRKGTSPPPGGKKREGGKKRPFLSTTLKEGRPVFERNSLSTTLMKAPGQGGRITVAGHREKKGGGGKRGGTRSQPAPEG